MPTRSSCWPTGAWRSAAGMRRCWRATGCMHGCGHCRPSRKRNRKEPIEETRTMIEEQRPEDLGHAGAVVDKAIEYMAGQNIHALSIASALLGGAMALLARSVADEAIVQILNNAIASVRSGELRGVDSQRG